MLCIIILQLNLATFKRLADLLPQERQVRVCDTPSLSFHQVTHRIIPNSKRQLYLKRFKTKKKIEKMQFHLENDNCWNCKSASVSWNGSMQFISYIGDSPCDRDSLRRSRAAKSAENRRGKRSIAHCFWRSGSAPNVKIHGKWPWTICTMRQDCVLEYPRFFSTYACRNWQTQTWRPNNSLCSL